MDMFRKEVAHAMNLAAEMSTSDFSVILKHLARDKGVIIYDDHVSVNFRFDSIGPN